MERTKTVWEWIGMGLTVLGGLGLAGGLWAGINPLAVLGFGSLGAGVIVTGLRAVVFGEAQVRLGRYHTQYRSGLGARFLGLQEMLVGAVLGFGGVWQTLRPGEPLAFLNTPPGWSLAAVLAGAFLLLLGLISASGIADNSGIGFIRAIGRGFGALFAVAGGLVLMVGLIGFAFPDLWWMLIGLVVREVR